MIMKNPKDLDSKNKLIVELHTPHLAFCWFIMWMQSPIILWPNNFFEKNLDNFLRAQVMKTN